MVDRAPHPPPAVVGAKNLADLYGLPLVEWTAVAARLAAGVTQAPGSGGPNRHTCWLATVNPDGSPHVTGVGALWFEEAFWIETGTSTRKARNLARDPRCSLSVATQPFDLVVDCVAEKLGDPATVDVLAEQWRQQGWPATVDASGIALTAPYSAPSAGPPPWRIYRLSVRRATALDTEGEGGATRWEFAAEPSSRREVDGAASQ